MKRAFGLGPAVDGLSVDCPTCERRKGLLCAKKATASDRHGVIKPAVGEWIGASRRCHPARIDAAIAAKQSVERGKPCP